MVVYIVMLHAGNKSLPHRVFGSQAKANRFVSRKVLQKGQTMTVVPMAVE